MPLRTKDGDLNVVTFGTVIDAAGNTVAKTALSDGNGTPYSGSNPVPTARAGSTGLDHSVNAAAVPGGAPLLTIPANPGRAFVEVQNQSGNTLQLVRDDGAGNNSTSILLTGVGAGQQGAGWSSQTFRGRVRVYGPAGSQVAACQD